MSKILIMAGHQGLRRNYGSGSTPSVGTSGTPAIGDEEYKLTPLVANQVAQLLRAAGHTVIREDAFFDQKYNVDIAMSIHFDGSGTPCASGHSFGYPAGVPAGSNKPTVDIIRAAYVPFLPPFVNVMRDNFTGALSGNYAYAWTSTEIAEFVIELCELSCPEQSAWALNRIEDGWFGRVLAHGLDKAAGGNKIPHPGKWAVPSVPPVTSPDVIARLDKLEQAVVDIRAEIRAVDATAKSSLSAANRAQDEAKAAHARLNKLHQV